MAVVVLLFTALGVVLLVVAAQMEEAGNRDSANPEPRPPASRPRDAFYNPPHVWTTFRRGPAAQMGGRPGLLRTELGKWADAIRRPGRDPYDW